MNERREEKKILEQEQEHSKREKVIEIHEKMKNPPQNEKKISEMKLKRYKEK